EDGVDGLLLGCADEAARVHDQHICRFRIEDDLAAVARDQAEHHFAVYEVLGTAQALQEDFGAHDERCILTAPAVIATQQRTGRAPPVPRHGSRAGAEIALDPGATPVGASPRRSRDYTPDSDRRRRSAA